MKGKDCLYNGNRYYYKWVVVHGENVMRDCFRTKREAEKLRRKIILNIASHNILNKDIDKQMDQLKTIRDSVKICRIIFK